MILHQFRQHLAEQIGRLPMEPNAATQSYAVTTAALGRKILDYLNTEDLTLPNGLSPEDPPYKLGTVLDRIIHFKTLGQDAISFDYPGKPDLVTLYSDRNLPFTDHIYLRLADYRESMERLANDDLLVGHYLLRQAVTLMAKAENTEDPQTLDEEVPHHELRRTIYGLLTNSWNVVYDLERSGKINVKPEPFECYENPCDGQAKAHDGFTTWKELIDGYPEQWVFASFNPRRIDVEGTDTYCMFVSAARNDDKQGLLGLVLPFRTISSMFADVRQQIGGALADGSPSAMREGQ